MDRIGRSLWLCGVHLQFYRWHLVGLRRRRAKRVCASGPDIHGRSGAEPDCICHLPSLDLGPRLARAVYAAAWAVPDAVAARRSLGAIAMSTAGGVDAIPMVIVARARRIDVRAWRSRAAMTAFEPSRAAALNMLTRFVPNAGHHYAEHRSFDFGSGRRDNISMLSPYIRHRILSEQEVVAAVLCAHGPISAGKFIQEVFWRTYWKGWLEQRPAVWHDYLDEVAELQTRPIIGLQDACSGQTGIECFDHWARELVDTGFLHNHARMWFASIWIFTLGLPWQMGAHFFLQHLLDGDPASNTLSWRWVAGLQTVGKHYVASADNIERYTNGVFARPRLVTNPAPLTAISHPEPALIKPLPEPPSGRYALLLSEDDMHPVDAIPAGVEIASIATLSLAQPCADNVAGFRRTALQNSGDALSVNFGVAHMSLDTWDAQAIAEWARQCGVSDVLAAEAPVGFAASNLTRLAEDLAGHGLRLRFYRRPWDDLCWPHARKGFFPFKEKIPAIIRELNMI